MNGYYLHLLAANSSKPRCSLRHILLTPIYYDLTQALNVSILRRHATV